jgi:hypothetical protein
MKQNLKKQPIIEQGITLKTPDFARVKIPPTHHVKSGKSKGF